MSKGVTITASPGADTYRAGGTLVSGVNTTDVGNVTTGEDNLMTFSLLANTLSVDGDRIEIEAAFSLGATANAKTVKFHFGATAAYTTGTLAINNGVMVIRATVIRTGAATQDILVTASSNNALLTTALLAAYTTAAETLSGAVTVKFTGEGTDTDDIIQKIMTVKFYPVNS